MDLCIRPNHIYHIGIYNLSFIETLQTNSAHVYIRDGQRHAMAWLRQAHMCCALRIIIVINYITHPMAQPLSKVKDMLVLLFLLPFWAEIRGAQRIDGLCEWQREKNINIIVSVKFRCFLCGCGGCDVLTCITLIGKPVSFASCSRMCRVGFGVWLNAVLSTSNCLALIVVRGPRRFEPLAPSSGLLFSVCESPRPSGSPSSEPCLVSDEKYWPC